jgi:hypothetical protein
MQSIAEIHSSKPASVMILAIQSSQDHGQPNKLKERKDQMTVIVRLQISMVQKGQKRQQW